MNPRVVSLKRNKINKPLNRLIRKRERERTQINKIKNEREITDIKETQRIVKQYYEQLYDNRLDNLEEMDKLPRNNNLPKLNQQELENLNRQVTSSEIEGAIKNALTGWLHG